MRAVAIWISRLFDLVFSRRRDARLDEEIATHLEHLRAEHEQRGMSPAAAADAARRSFGGVDQTKRRFQDQRGWPAVESLVQDVRFAARYLLRHRSFSGPLVAVLALGMGVGHMFFTLTYAHTMRGLPIDGVDRVVAVAVVDAQGRDQLLSDADFDDTQAAQRTFAALAAHASGPVTLNVADQVPDRYAGTFTTASGFAAAGVRPVMGRLFSPSDEAPGAPVVVVLTERIWRGRFAADPEVPGREVLVNGTAATIVGVIPDKSGFPSAAAVFLPLAARPGHDRPAPVRALQAFGRLAPGITMAEVQADLDAIAASMASSRPDTNSGVRLRATAINQRLIGGRVGGWLPFIAAGGIVVAVASTNAGNLVLAGAAARAREVAIRTSLGASRMRVVRQLLIESLLFAAVAAGLGLTLSRAGVALHASAIPADSMPYWFDYSLDRTVFAWLWLIMLAMVIVFALVPAWQASRTSAVEVLNDGGRADTGRGGRFGASLFLAVQLGLAVVLVTQVGVAALKGAPRLATDRLLEDGRVLTGSLALPADRYATTEARSAFRTRLAEQLRAVPGLIAVAFASAGPMEGSPERQLLIAGRDEAAPAQRAHLLEIDPGYFGLLGAGIVRGRDFDDRDGSADRRVAIVNERTAALHFPAIDPLGQRIALRPAGDTSAPAWATIVGVVPDIRHREGDPAATAIVYTPLAAGTTPTVALLVRGAADAAALTPAVREAIRRLDPFVPLARPRSLPVAVREGTWVGRTSARLANTVCLAAFAMAAFGLFAVISHRMALRRREIGLRMALGADGRRIARVVVGSVGRALVAGLLLGVLGVVAWDRSFAPGYAEARGLGVLSATLAVLSAVVVAGGAVPVMRALRIAPADALRRE